MASVKANARVRLCPACAGEPVVLGRLGNLTWYRCRACGMEYHGKEYHGKARARRKTARSNRRPHRKKNPGPRKVRRVAKRITAKTGLLFNKKLVSSEPLIHVREKRGRRKGVVLAFGAGGYYLVRWKGDKNLFWAHASKLRVIGKSVRKNRAIDTAWTGKKADFVSPLGNYGQAPHSELAMHTGAAGKKVVRFALWSAKDRWPYVIWAHIQTEGGQVLDGTAGEVLTPWIRRHLGEYGSEKLPMIARMKR